MSVWVLASAQTSSCALKVSSYLGKPAKVRHPREEWTTMPAGLSTFFLWSFKRAQLWDKKETFAPPPFCLLSGHLRARHTQTLPRPHLLWRAGHIKALLNPNHYFFLICHLPYSLEIDIKREANGNYLREFFFLVFALFLVHLFPFLISGGGRGLI